MTVGGTALGSGRRRRTPRPAISERAVLLTGTGVIAGYILMVAVLMTRTPFDRWGGAVYAPILIAITIPALRRQAAREGNPRLFWLLLAGLVVKLIGALAREYVSFGIYGAAESDASGYHGNGVKIAADFRSGDLDPSEHLNPDQAGHASITDAMFIRLLTGIIYTITGPSLLAGYMVYSWLGFLGLFAFYRAFVMAVPGGRRLFYARLLFFAPSMLFWPSGIGKEAWMVFVLGICALGVAHLVAGRSFRGLVIAGLGLAGVLVVRPHMAGIVGVALSIAYLLGKPRAGGRAVSPHARMAVLGVILVGAGFLLAQAKSYVEESLLANAYLVDDSLRGSDASSLAGVQNALVVTSARTEIGGSSFSAPSILESPANLPLGIVTVLFRPFLFEADGVGLLLAALEGTFLLGLAAVRIQSIVAAVRHVRRIPFATFTFAYTGMFIIAFSSIGNFGILARQRVTLLPFFMVLLCLPARAEDGDRDGARA